MNDQCQKPTRVNKDETPPSRRFNRVKRCRHGAMLFNIHDLFVGRSLNIYGEYAEQEVALFEKIIRPGDTVLDVGANIGAHTLFFANTVGDDGLVFAFEPQRVVYQTLCGNLAMNSHTNTHAFQFAVGKEPGSLNVPPIDYRYENDFAGLELGTYGYGESVQVIGIDDLGLRYCRFIKISASNMEEQILEGARETLEAIRPILYNSNCREDRIPEVVDRICAMDYDIHWH
ncbi:MAG: FkbM family methyltransferase, partial [Magnetococcales bacterium]|nr:FkbM family methyltransferase [Magnetococcales bacterium]